MEAELISQISTVGFPIIAYFLLFFHQGKIMDKLASSIDRLTVVMEQKV